MRFASKIVVWCSLLAVAGLVIARPVRAQDTLREKATEAAREGAIDAEDPAHASGGPNPLGFDPDLALFTAGVFLLLFVILSVFAWPQISAALLERERNIEGQIAAAAAKHEEAKQLLAAHEAKLAAAAGEVRALLEEARRDADHTRKRIETEGHKAAKDELDRAIREIDRAKNGAIEELSKSTANVAIDLARNIVGDRITSDQQASIVREAMGKLAAASPSKN
jgi:F-type H+-transporting ATPase subunit b